MAETYEHLRERGLTQESVFRGKQVRVRVDTVALPDGEIATREIVEHPGAVAIMPVTDQGEVVFVRQFRYAINRVTLELPAGKIDLGENEDQAALRELVEETGLAADTIDRLAEVVISPGYTNERIVIYRATGLKLVAPRPEADEFIETVRMPLEEAIGMVREGRIQDAKTVIALLWSERR